MGPAPRTARCGLVGHRRADRQQAGSFQLHRSHREQGRGAVQHQVEENPGDTRYAIASASKLLMAITTLRLVDSGELSLESSPADILPFWTQDPEDPRTSVTLEQLLSFTSGFSGGSGLSPTDVAPDCVEDPMTGTVDCAAEIFTNHFEFSPAGSTFYYGPSHMFVAAAMAMEVRNAPTWNTLFRDEIADDLGFSALSGFLAPSPINGRPGGGVILSGNEYGAILTALLAGELLSSESMEQLTTDRTPSASVVLSNVPNAASQSGEWHYALGCWRECPGNYDAENCDAPGVVSSPGAFGFYPWWDQKNGLWGVISLQLAIPGSAAIVAPIGAEIRSLVNELLSNG